MMYIQKYIPPVAIVKIYIAEVTTHVVRLKLFRLKAERGRRARFPYFGGNI